VHALLARYGITEAVGTDGFYTRISDAVNAFQETP
jgi:hypothetical protein